MIRAVILTSLLVSATANAAPPSLTPLLPPPEMETSYRSYTVAADAVAIGLLVAGAMSEGPNGRDTDASEALMGAGALALLVTPTIHAVRGHGKRAAKSLALRWGMASAGMLAAVALNSSCHDNAPPPPPDQLLGDDFLCELDYVGYGVLGGLVVAMMLDAAYMTDEKKPRTRWTPSVSGNRDGFRVGASWTW